MSYASDALADAQEREIKKLKAENTKLQELVGLWSVINKHMSLCATTECGQCPVREECSESVHLEGLLGIDSKELSWRVQERITKATASERMNVLAAENAKLREYIERKQNLQHFARLVDENSKLRKYAKLIHDHIKECCDACGEHDICDIDALTRSLGIEVSEC